MISQRTTPPGPISVVKYLYLLSSYGLRHVREARKDETSRREGRYDGCGWGICSPRAYQTTIYSMSCQGNV